MLIKIEGYGLQTYAGTVPFATYEYFQQKGIDLEDYNDYLESFDSDESSLNMPEE